MTSQRARPIDMAFVRSGTPMFAEIIDQLQADKSLSNARRRDMISGLRRIAKALGLPPQDVPCDSRWLQPRLAKIAPARLGLTAKSWQNAVSDARAALVHFGLAERRSNRIEDLTEDWRILWSKVLAEKDRTLQPALCRFVYFLSKIGVHPSSVCSDHAQAYHEALLRNEISKSPEVGFRAAVNGWNLAVRRIPAWPKIILPLNSRQVIIAIQLSEFPTSFQKDLDDLILRLTKPDPLAEAGPGKVLRPATISQYRRQLVRFASELVHSGIAIGDVSSLDFLIDPVMAERGLRQMLSRTDNQTTKLISETAALLRNLARILDAPDDVRDRLVSLAKRVATKPQTGMTRKNRDRLRVLQEERNQLRLLLLPKRIFARPVEKGGRFSGLLAREDALAIAILLVCPIRIKNLAGIHLERNLHRPGDGHVYLVLQDEETKNERTIEFELPRDIIRWIDAHLKSRVPDLCQSGTPWLFPRRDGLGPVGANALSARLSKRIRNETGLEMNAHLFRHFAVMTWLDANPGGYEVARRLLGHSAVSHTINMYSGLEARSATRAFADLVARKKSRHP
ncbi:site-specific integrase [Ruegeria marina]|uniref:Site-specific recombinase XerD n=1 Tax=Ruegeria marina TaxID=639004 RepID=A0A1G7FCJ6_9RHOB|nr:site-specific integrase [Ruegeria marina]SDE73554.1 Site-specific recombinase XerD [Ruegeria marina]